MHAHTPFSQRCGNLNQWRADESVGPVFTLVSCLPLRPSLFHHPALAPGRSKWPSLTTESRATIAGPFLGHVWIPIHPPAGRLFLLIPKGATKDQRAAGNHKRIKPISNRKNLQSVMWGNLIRFNLIHKAQYHKSKTCIVYISGSGSRGPWASISKMMTTLPFLLKYKCTYTYFLDFICRAVNQSTMSFICDNWNIVSGWAWDCE